MNPDTSLRPGMKLPYFQKRGRPSPVSSGDLNLLVKALNALLNPSVVTGQTNKVDISDSQWKLTLDNTLGGGVVTSPASNSLAFYHLRAVYGDYIVCRTWDGTVEGDTDIVIAKPEKLRESVSSEVKFNTQYTYTYADASSIGLTDTLNALNKSNNRVRNSYNTSDTTTEAELVIPIWIPGSNALANASITNGVVSGLDLTYGGMFYANAPALPPLVAIVGGGGSGATASATVVGGVVTALTLLTNGSGYTSAPQVLIAASPQPVPPDIIAAYATGVPVPGVVDANGNAIGYLMLEDNRHWAQISSVFQGIPAGGATGQVLEKNSGTNYDVSWVTPSSTTSGTSGSSGTSGAAGAAGSNGTSGTSGTSGSTGATGSNGTSGTSGSSGSSNGTSGSSGTSGSTGAAGSNGTSGTSGSSGSSGSSGTSGTSGSTGAAGSNGTSGTSGTSGASSTTVYQFLHADFSTTNATATATNFTFAVSASDLWIIDAQLTCSTGSTGGIEYQITTPASSVIEGWIYSTDAGGTLTATRLTATSTLTAAIHSANDVGSDHFFITVNVGTGGNITLAAASANSGDTSKILKGSSLMARKATSV